MSKINRPNFTQVPNVYLDNQHELSFPEVKVMNAICRMTFGWQTETSSLSISKLCNLTGLSRNGVLSGLENLMLRKWIKRTPVGQSFNYEIDIEEIGQPVLPAHQCTGSTGPSGAPEPVLPAHQLGSPHIVLKERKKETPRKSASGEFPKIVEAFCKEFESQFKTKYHFQGGRDGKAVKAFVSSGRTADELIKVAKAAWNHMQTFACKKAVDLHGLYTYWNQINAELVTIDPKESWREVKRLEQKIKEHPANTEYNNCDIDEITPEMRKDLRALREKLKEAQSNA